MERTVSSAYHLNLCSAKVLVDTWGFLTRKEKLKNKALFWSQHLKMTTSSLDEKTVGEVGLRKEIRSCLTCRGTQLTKIKNKQSRWQSQSFVIPHLFQHGKMEYKDHSHFACFKHSPRHSQK